MNSVDTQKFNMTLNQLQGMFNQLGGSSVKGSTYINSVFGITGSILQIASDDDCQRSYGIKNLANQITNLFMKLVNIQSSASSRVREDSDATDNVIEISKDTEKELNRELKETANSIKDQTKIVENTTEEISKTQKALEEKEKEIQKIIDKITKLQATLASTTDPNVQKELLEEIASLGIQISAHVVEVQDLQDDVTESADNIEKAFIEIETAKGNAVEVQENGELQVVQAVQEATSATKSTVSTQADGVKNITIGSTLEGTAAASAAIPIVGGVISSQTAQRGAEFISAGTTETAGSIANLNTLLQGIGKIQNNTKLLSTFKTAIGGALNSFNNSIGAWNTAIDPVITSIGSFVNEDGYKVQSANLISTVHEDMQIVNKYISENKTSTSKEITASNEDENTTENTGLSPEYELETPKFKFGI